jgi:hypothetical protein
MPAAIVDSSWIDMLAGLAKPGICRIPPGFCADAGSATAAANPSPSAARPRRSPRIISVASLAAARFPVGYHLSDRSAYLEDREAMAELLPRGVLLPKLVSIMTGRCTCSKSAAKLLALVEILLTQTALI